MLTERVFARAGGHQEPLEAHQGPSGAISSFLRFYRRHSEKAVGIWRHQRPVSAQKKRAGHPSPALSAIIFPFQLTLLISAAWIYRPVTGQISPQHSFLAFHRAHSVRIHTASCGKFATARTGHIRVFCAASNITSVRSLIVSVSTLFFTFSGPSAPCLISAGAGHIFSCRVLGFSFHFWVVSLRKAAVHNAAPFPISNAPKIKINRALR